jgi:hypothetical protein
MEEMGYCDQCPQNCPALAMAYVPDQQWRNVYTSDVGFHRGTIFAELDKPFIGEEAVCGNE